MYPNKTIPVKGEAGNNNFFRFLWRNGPPYFVATTSKAFAAKIGVGSLLEIQGQVFRVERLLTQREYTNRYNGVRPNFGRQEVGWYEVITD